MSQADELLKSVAGNSRLVNPDFESHIVVGEDRFITIPDELKRIAVQYDHDIETVTFDCPRYWDGHDMSQMQIYINYARPDGSLGSYIAQNVTVDEEDDTIMHFTWTISSHVTELKGKISFLVCVKRMEEVVVGEKVETPAGVIWYDEAWFRGEGTTDNLKHVCYGNDKYIAVGENGSTYYRGSHGWWFHGKSAGDKTLYSVTYGNNKFVAVGDSDHIYYSEDGEQWSISNSAVMPDTLRDVVYGNGVYVAVGCDGIIYSSRDGIDWSTVVGEISKTLDLLSVVYGNGKFMAVDSGGGVYISTDGINWSSGNPINNGSTYYYIKDVVYGNNKFVAVGGYNDGYVFYSEDGEQWSQGNINSDHQLKSIAYGNTLGVDMFVAVDNEVGGIYYSSDGINWTKGVEQASGLYGLTYGLNQFVAVGDNGSIYSSSTHVVPAYEQQLTNHWNSELCDSIYISEGMETEETIIESNPDIFAQLVELMNTTDANTKGYMNDAKNSAAEASMAKDQAVASAAEAKSYVEALGGEVIKATDAAEQAAKVADEAAKSASDAQSTVDTLNQALEHVEELTEGANTSATTATTKAEEAATSATNAKASEEMAKQHEKNTMTYKSQALTYCEQADSFKQSAETAATNAAASATAADDSAVIATMKAEEASVFASEASQALESIGIVETNAAKSATDAATSAEAAAESEQNAKTSDTNAKTSETNAATSAEAAAASASKALVSEENAARLAHNADTYRSQAFTAADSARASATNATTSETNAATSEANAKDSETAAKTSETNAAASAEAAAESERSAWEAVENIVSSGSGIPIVRGTGNSDGSIFTATCEDITELYNGLKIIFVPDIHTKANATLKLTINELGQSDIKRALSNGITSTSTNSLSGTIASGHPVELTYRVTGSTGVWIADMYTQPVSADLYGTVPVNKGGTGATDAAGARTNLGLNKVDNTSDADKPISTATQTALNNKVDKVSGKGLSTNDYTTTEKNKLSGIAAGAQVNSITGVKGNSETTYRTGNVNITPANIGLGNVNNTSDANKPISTATQTALDNKVDKVSGKGLSTNDYTTTEKNKLSGIEAGAQKNQSLTAGDGIVLSINPNKPDDITIGVINKLPIILMGNSGDSTCSIKLTNSDYNYVTKTMLDELYMTDYDDYFSKATDNSIIINKDGYYEVVFSGLFNSMDASVYERVKRLTLVKMTSATNAVTPTYNVIVSKASRIMTWESFELHSTVKMSAGDRYALMAQCEGATESTPATFAYMNCSFIYVGA